MTRLERFRANRDTFFREHQHSPLLPEQRDVFTGLRYYPEDPALRFEVALNEAALSHDPVEIETTTEERKTYILAGTVDLAIGEEIYSLIVFREPGRGRYFLPFRDTTAGVETYGAGRYLDPQETPKGTLIVDFNYAYNPYCAYGDRWSCPLPPFANRLSIPIRAGEQAFPKDEPAG